MITKVNSGFLLSRVRKESPVIHHLTNWVTIYDCAQAVKSLGGSPVMAHALEEVGEMAEIASALVLNIGTLTSELVEAMKKAAGVANKRGIPVVFDVCGAGATKFRDKKCQELFCALNIGIIKGNASEVASLAGERVKTKGVDSAVVRSNINGLAAKLAIKNKCTVVVTGAEDIVTDGKFSFRIKNGDRIMSSVVGTGCIAASVIASFAAVENNLTIASAAGLACFEVASEIAAVQSKGPGTFKEKLFDELYLLTPEVVNKSQKITC